MTRDERRLARLAVIAAERDKNPRGYAKRAARILNLSIAQIWYLASHWGLTCQRK